MNFIEAVTLWIRENFPDLKPMIYPGDTLSIEKHVYGEVVYKYYSDDTGTARGSAGMITKPYRLATISDEEDEIRLYSTMIPANGDHRAGKIKLADPEFFSKLETHIKAELRLIADAPKPQ